MLDRGKILYFMFSDRSFAVVTARARNLISEWCSIVEDCGRCCGFSDRIVAEDPIHRTSQTHYGCTKLGKKTYNWC